jgi:pimeloyl-ACP methyl ester carboxylesterase
MRYYALGGLNYPIGRFLPTNVEETGTRLWVKGSVNKLLDHITSGGERVTLIGFSKGASIAIELALRSPLITKVHAHSPGPFNRPSQCFTQADFTFYHTVGDRLTTDSSITDVRFTLSKIVGKWVPYQLLAPLPFQKPLGLLERFMQNRCHQFHNASQMISDEINRQETKT